MKSALPGLLVALMSTWVLACKPADGKPQPEAPKPKTSLTKLTGTRVEVAVVQPSRRSLEVTIPGEVEGYRDASLASALGGYIERVHVEEGERVKAGQVLALVDSTTHEARRGRARVELQAAKRELARAQSLKGAIPQVELDAAEDRVLSAEAAVRELNVNASRAVVKAPFAGVVVKRDAEVGEVAAPGAPLFRIVKLSPIKVTISLSDRDVPLATPGTPARIALDARAGVYTGKVTHVSPAADLKTRSFQATVEVANDDETLLPGMIARVTLSSAQTNPNAASKQAKEQKGAAKKPSQPGAKDSPAEADTSELPGDQLVISQDWLVTKPDGIGVFVEAQGKAEWRSVQLGEILRNQVVVQTGLNPGDALIIVGHRELAAGDEVLVHRKGKCCTAGRAVF